MKMSAAAAAVLLNAFPAAAARLLLRALQAGSCCDSHKEVKAKAPKLPAGATTAADAAPPQGWCRATAAQPVPVSVTHN
jgi:hypothetical protein